ncbi:Neutrophil cytosol factor 4 [Liparis tanakae]|uniref:Neutrophil cytosol factor 4 n=1 Tax=Liparis tanakae TaxID=230148 RepID=A0A4Z2EGJ0_9TELE|nr:Neutrophil cytosol factor 4 [Liparis tanakae]
MAPEGRALHVHTVEQLQETRRANALLKDTWTGAGIEPAALLTTEPPRPSGTAHCPLVADTLTIREFRKKKKNNNKHNNNNNNNNNNNEFSDVPEGLIQRDVMNVFQLDDVAVNYRDLEGDLVRVLDDEDVQLMIRESRGQRVKVTRPVNQFPWELYVTLTSDLSVYNTEA